jgi:hypothetical protein
MKERRVGLERGQSFCASLAPIIADPLGSMYYSVLFRTITKRTPQLTSQHNLLTRRYRYIMTTREISIRFMPLRNPSAPEWEYKQTVPASLCAPADVQSTSAYMELFRRKIGAIIPKYQVECDRKAGDACTNCGGRSITSLLTPCSYLHKSEDPFINVLLHPVCGLPQCRSATGLLIQETMNGVDELSKEMGCEVCGKCDGVRKCSKCKTVEYCGRDCQKQDWRNHKKVCTQLANQRMADGPA